MAEVKIPIQTKYDGKGFDQLQKDAARAQRELTRQTRQTLAEHRKVVSLTNKLDRDLAKEARKRGEQTVAVNQFIAAAGVAALFEAKRAIDLAKEQAAAEAQLYAALNSTGHAAGMTAGELKNLASQLQSTTNYGDEATLQAEAMLLTFTKVGREVFPRATQAILDVSTAMKQDLKTSTIQIGKALNEPVEGLSALRRVGIQFTDQQEAQIKTLVASGRVTEAQTVILAELERQFGGSAAAAREADAGFQAAANAVGDLEESLGKALLPTTREYNRLVIEAAQGWTVAIEAISLLAKAHDDLAESERGGLLGLRDTIASYDDWFEKINPVYALTQNLIEAGLDYAFDQENLAKAVQKVTAEEEAAAAAAKGHAVDTEEAAAAAAKAAAAAAEAAAAQEELAKRLEKVNEIRRNTAREMVAIEERNAEDISKVWTDYWKDQEKEWQDHNKTLKNIEKKAASEQKKADKDLAKSLADLDKDTSKQIREAQKRTATDERHESKRRQVDALADERLFTFELQQLAAEGQGNAIRAAIERRAIEEQIAKEKAAVESQIEAEKRQDEIAGIREAAAEKRASLHDDFEEEKALRAERLAEDLAAEQSSYADRMVELRGYREEKLRELEASRLEALETLARELAESGELTKSKLAALIPTAATLGEEAGRAFAEGINRGVETNLQVDEMLGEGRSTTRQPASRRPSRPGQRFQFGGVVGGPIGSPQMIVAHGGEPVGIPPISLSVSVGQIGAGMDPGRVEKIVEPLFQRFVNDVLIPAFS